VLVTASGSNHLGSARCQLSAFDENADPGAIADDWGLKIAVLPGQGGEGKLGFKMALKSM
jgi:hypothetical protein